MPVDNFVDKEKSEIFWCQLSLSHKGESLILRRHIPYVVMMMFQVDDDEMRWWETERGWTLLSCCSSSSCHEEEYCSKSSPSSPITHHIVSSSSFIHPSLFFPFPLFPYLAQERVPLSSFLIVHWPTFVQSEKGRESIIIHLLTQGIDFNSPSPSTLCDPSKKLVSWCILSTLFSLFMFLFWSFWSL